MCCLCKHPHPCTSSVVGQKGTKAKGLKMQFPDNSAVFWLSTRAPTRAQRKFNSALLSGRALHSYTAFSEPLSSEPAESEGLSRMLRLKRRALPPARVEPGLVAALQ